MKELKVKKKLFDAIAEEIHSDKSPVGIDAKKTHVLILEKLIQQIADSQRIFNFNCIPN